MSRQEVRRNKRKMGKAIGKDLSKINENDVKAITDLADSIAKKSYRVDLEKFGLMK